MIPARQAHALQMQFADGEQMKKNRRVAHGGTFESSQLVLE